MKKVFLFIPIITLALFSCSNDESSREHNAINESETSFNMARISDPSNSNNPFDFYGKMHNDVIDVFVKNTDITDSLSMKTIVDTTNNILTAHEDYDQYIIGGSLITSSELEPFVDDFPDDTDTIINSTNLSSNVKTELKQLLKHFVDIAYGDEIEYQEAFDYIVNYEQSILSNNSLSSTEKENILGSTSIARHSMHYWSNYYSQVSTSNKEPYEWWQWVVVGAADVAGGAIGAAGGPGTAISGGAAASGAGFAWMDHVSDRK